MFNRNASRTRRSNAAVPSGEAAPSITALNWRRLFSYLTPYRGKMALAILALLVSCGLAWPSRWSSCACSIR